MCGHRLSVKEIIWPEIERMASLKAAESENFEIRDKDVIAVTEAVVARAQGNYAKVDDIAEDVKEKFGDDTVGILFPILSRNRFSDPSEGNCKGM